jgi:YbgC/YbaW family acyl-CoA thioester hydrolase
MSRVKLKIPTEKPLFITTIPVRISDINYGGHVGNDAFLSIIHETRMQLLKHFGFDELNAGGNSLIMADVMIAYKSEAFYGDILTINMYIDEITAKSFDIIYDINTIKNGINKNIIQAKTGMVCFDYATRRIANMTDELKYVLQKR